jgi:O-antigen/teichoic acid export membrane protein
MSRASRDSGFATLVELLAVVVSLVSFYLLALSLGKGAYGQFGAVYSVIAPLATLIGLGPSIAALQGGIRDGSDLELGISQALGAHASMALPAVAISAIILKSTTTFEFAPLFALIVAELVLNAAVGIVGVARELHGGVRAKHKLQAFATLLRLALIGGLAALGALNTTNYFVGLLVTGSIAMVVGVRARVLRNVRLRMSLPRGGFLKASLGLSISLFALGIQSDLDKMILVVVGDPEAAGGYTAAYRIVTIATVPIAAVVGARHRQFMNQPTPAALMGFTIRFTKWVVLYAFAAVAGVVTIAPFVDNILGPEYHDVPSNMVWLAPMIVSKALAACPLNTLLAFDAIWARSTLIVGNAGLSVALYTVLIPRFGVSGAAIGTALSEATLAGGAWFLIRRRHQLHTSEKRPNSPAFSEPAEQTLLS